MASKASIVRLFCENWGGWISVGEKLHPLFGGVCTEIKIYKENGEMAEVNWYHVYKDDGGLIALNGKFVEGVEWSPVMNLDTSKEVEE